MTPIEQQAVEMLRQQATYEQVTSKCGIGTKAIQRLIYRHGIARSRKGGPGAYRKMEVRKPADPAFTRRPDVFQPPQWVRLDGKLFDAVTEAVETGGTVYAALAAFAVRHGLAVASVTARWHLIARKATA